MRWRSVYWKIWEKKTSFTCNTFISADLTTVYVIIFVHQLLQLAFVGFHRLRVQLQSTSNCRNAEFVKQPPMAKPGGPMTRTFWWAMSMKLKAWRQNVWSQTLKASWILPPVTSQFPPGHLVNRLCDVDPNRGDHLKNLRIWMRVNPNLSIMKHGKRWYNYSLIFKFHSLWFLSWNA